MKSRQHDNDAEERNPCFKETELTLKCFHDNNFDKGACQMEMENYKLCKSFWHSVRKDRRKKGLSPVMPPLEERDSVKKEYFDKFKPSS